MSNLRVITAILLSALALAAQPAQADAPTLLGIAETHFTINGHPTFLLGISYYAGLGASEDFIRHDLDDLQRHHFNWLRVWATWGAFGKDVSAVDRHGKAREPFLGKLKWLVAECDRRGLIVDVTLTRGKAEEPGHLPDMPAHRRAVEVIVTALKDRPNWYLDLANEHDIRDDRNVPTAELKTLREIARAIDPKRLVTASFGGHDLTESDLRDALLTVRLDFLAPHRPRDPKSPAQTQSRTQECLAAMKKIGRQAPVQYQEPFRRGYTKWEPTADDFLTDLRGAVAGGAAGWCFHNGAQRATPDQRPRRSFDLSAQRLFDQFDPDERKFIATAARTAGLSR
jgi:hypothetical protein